MSKKTSINIIKKYPILFSILFGFICIIVAIHGYFNFSTKKQNEEFIKSTLENFSIVLKNDKSIENCNISDKLSFENISQYLIDAVLIDEDSKFFSRRIIGATLISQLLAGSLYNDRRDISVQRHINELRNAIQMEKNFSKNEIITMFLNIVYFGHGNYGIEAAQEWFHNKTLDEMTIAEAAMLAVQLSNPGGFSPYNNREIAESRQKKLLNRMVEAQLLSKTEADFSYAEYWTNFHNNN